ncbi:MAG: tetratricopeptide repeat protein, partial [Anaerolineae bacterium]|nr:tetratricopeptide repeat protein [Anaerolineae bacterium]
MAEISLREYLGNMRGLLRAGSPAEVIHHCRHILLYFPKNADAYRYMGEALIDTAKWEEAGEMFRRVLSVYPDDYTAHLGLSDVYLHTDKPDAAIWHLERAFEQDPNNQGILDTLRQLYRDHKRVERVKVQLTSGAVARQYSRNGLYDQAINVLRQTIQATPDRTDVRLLLAQTYQEAGMTIEAGEAAMDVLRQLPNCLEANRILTELWLSHGRTSDAQRHLSRIEAVDPYLALEIVQRQSVPDEAFRLPELDYQQSARREIATRTPDWLQALGDDEGAPIAYEEEAPADTSDFDFPSFMSEAPAEAAPAAPSPAMADDDLFGTDLPDDWLSGDFADEADDMPAPPVSSGS